MCTAYCKIMQPYEHLRFDNGKKLDSECKVMTVRNQWESCNVTIYKPTTHWYHSRHMMLCIKMTEVVSCNIIYLWFSMTSFSFMFDMRSPFTRTKSDLIKPLASISRKASPTEMQSSLTMVMISQGLESELHLEALKQTGILIWCRKNLLVAVVGT